MTDKGLIPLYEDEFEENADRVKGLEVMAAGQGANLTANPLEAVTTLTVQVVMLITGDTEASTAAGPAFTLAFTLFCITLALNIFALRFVRKYREKYD